MRNLEVVIRGARWAIEFNPEFRIVLKGQCMCGRCRRAGKK